MKQVSAKRVSTPGLKSAPGSDESGSSPTECYWLKLGIIPSQSSFMLYFKFNFFQDRTFSKNKTRVLKTTRRLLAIQKEKDAYI